MGFLNNISSSFFERILLSGAVVNFLLIILGSAFGILFKKGIPERIKNLLNKGMALCVLYIGITGIFKENINIIVIILSFALGAVIGELIDLDSLVKRIADKTEGFFNRKGGKTKIAEGFVTATLLFCVGAMAVVGSIESGISGDNSTLYSKSVIDGISAMTLAATFGIGVMFSAIPVLILEGALTLLAVLISPALTETFISHMSVIGSLLIVALSLNMMGLTKIKVMNFLTAMILPIVLCLFL